MGSNANSLTELGKVLKADPKKTGALAVLAVLLLVMVGRMTLSGGGNGRPQPAAAAVVAHDPMVSQASRTSPAGTSTQRPSVAWTAIQKWTDAPVPPISRNLFSVRIEYYPVEGSRTAQSALPDEGFWLRLEKSMAIQADQKDKRENLIANFSAQAAKLKLQSTMPGPQPRAMVNGELVGEGDVVADFRVLKIEARRIIVEREGIRLEIQMK